MTGVFESISLCLYAAGALLLAAAATVYKKNGLYEYYCLIHGRPAKKEGTAGNTKGLVSRKRKRNAFRSSEAGAGGNSPPVEKRGMYREKTERGTQVLDGKADTVLLENKNGAAGMCAEKTEENRVWTEPSERFKVTKSEVVVHTDKTIGARTATKGETDEAFG